MTRHEIRTLLEQVRSGALTPEAAQDRFLQYLRQAPFEDLGFARVDHHRSARQGFPEVIFGPGKSPEQIASIAVATAIAARNVAFSRAVEDWSRDRLDETSIAGARAAAAIMGMNNVYYRFLHLVEDEEYGTMPARLRMNVIGNPGINRLDFELLSLAVSAVNGCGLCITSHERKLREEFDFLGTPIHITVKPRNKNSPRGKK